MVNFFIHSMELRDYHQKHGCVVHDTVDVNKLLVELIPPVPGFIYGQIENIDLVVLAPRHTGVSLTPAILEWPCIVNICLPKEKGGWKTGPWRLIDIGEITQS